MLMSFGGGGGTAYASRAFAAHRRSQPEAVGAEENGQHGERLRSTMQILRTHTHTTHDRPLNGERYDQSGCDTDTDTYCHAVS